MLVVSGLPTQSHLPSALTPSSLLQLSRPVYSSALLSGTSAAALGAISDSLEYLADHVRQAVHAPGGGSSPTKTPKGKGFLSKRDADLSSGLLNAADLCAHSDDF